MALGNPFDMYMATLQAQNQNRQKAMEDAQGIGKNLSGLVDTITKQVLKNKLSKALQQPAELPVQGPQLPGAGMAPVPPRMGQPGTSMPNPAANIDPILAQLYPEEFARNRMMSPLQQSEINRNNAQAQKYQMGGASKPVGTIFRNSVTGEMTDDATVATGPAWKAYKTSQGDVLNKLAGQTSAAGRKEAMAGRVEAWNRSIDVKQIDQLAKSTGLTPKMQSALQQNNVRASRAIPILAKPQLTYQELALGEIDLAGIMQGGVPQVDEVKNTHFPGWQEQWASWKTYATGHPQEVVPPDVRKKVLGLVQDVIKIDNKFLQSNAKFAKQMIGPTIRGGIGQFDAPINEMTNVLTNEGQQPASGGHADPLGIR